VEVAPRQRFGRRLTGQVLEVGPGTTAFPTAPGSEVRFADRPLPGGRDASFPELVGEPHGPDADIEVDLDGGGLAGVPDEAYDGVVLSHVIEHVADPVGALQECERVLRPGGRLVLIVPLRHATFDASRPGTPLDHLVAEHRAGVTEVDVDHIREFCRSVYEQPPMHPDEVREWHDPDRLDDETIAIHRRRSIHAHCWDAEEMAAALVGLVALEELRLGLLDLFFADDPGASPIEFGLVLARGAGGVDAAEDLVDAWVTAVLADEGRDPQRVATFVAALVRDLPEVLPVGDARRLVARPSLTAARLLRTSEAERRTLRGDLEAAEVRVRDLAAELAAREAEVEEILASRTHRAGQAVTAPLRMARRLAR
jgi:SAM-dependent methyltransferase